MPLSTIYQNETARLNNPKKKNLPATIKPTELITSKDTLIRFEEKREHHMWAHPDEIIFVASADHYVKALIKCGLQNKWMSRHCTIKELHDILRAANFVRLNKFYLLNLSYFSRIDESEKMLYLVDDFYIPVPHRISCYIINMIKR